MNPGNGTGKPEAIFAKYFNGLQETNVRLGGIDEAAVRLAMHLAITDALALREQAPVGHVSSATDRRIAEWQQSQIVCLNEWLEQHRPDLYFDGNLSTAQAVLAALADLQGHLATAIKERWVEAHTNRRLWDWLRDNVEKDGEAVDDASLAIDTIVGLRAELASALADVKALGEELRKAEAMTAEQPGYEEQQNALTRWLIGHAPERIPEHRTVAGAVISILDEQRAAIANYDTALTHAQNENAMLRQQRADLQADLVQARALQDNFSDTLDEVAAQRDAALKEIAHLQSQTTNANGASLDPTPTPDWGPSHPAWQGLTADEQETITKLASGAIRFRSVPKGQRLILIGQVLRHIGGGGSKITMAQYNSQRPAWMAEATSITQYVESNKWQDVVTVALINTASR